jgi:hypothetical protein
LSRISFARPGKLFTAHVTLLQQEIACLTPAKLQTLRAGVIKIIQGEQAATSSSFLA